MPVTSCTTLSESLPIITLKEKKAGHSCLGAVLVSEVRVEGREVKDLTDGLLNHGHNEVVKLELGDGSVAVVIRGETVPCLIREGSDVATEEGSNVVPCAVTVASEEIHKEATGVGGELAHSLNDTDEASEGVLPLNERSGERGKRSGASHRRSEHGNNEEGDEFLFHFLCLID